MHGLVRCKHECRCSRARGADVSFKDVTIKIPDRGYNQGCEWRQALEASAEIWEKSVSWVPAGEEEGWLSGLVVARRIRALVGLRADDVKAVSIEGLCLFLPYVEKPFNSKLIKSFIHELRSRQVFFVFRDSYVIYVRSWTLWTFCIPVWICLFHISVSWVCYICRNAVGLFYSLSQLGNEA